MPLIKQTMFMQFAGSPTCGFSESWVYDGSVSGATAALNALIQARAKVLSESWSIRGGRSSLIRAATIDDACVLRQTLIQPFVCPVAVVGELGKTDTPWSALFISLFKRPSTSDILDVRAAGRPRQEQLRGIPDTWWTDAALSIPPLDLVKLNTFMNGVVTNPGFGTVKLNTISGCDATLQRYRTWCIRRISSRRIGRPFGLLRGAQRRQAQTP